jgi:hypothetical protein
MFTFFNKGALFITIMKNVMNMHGVLAPILIFVAILFLAFIAVASIYMLNADGGYRAVEMFGALITKTVDVQNLREAGLSAMPDTVSTFRESFESTAWVRATDRALPYPILTGVRVPGVNFACNSISTHVQRLHAMVRAGHDDIRREVFRVAEAGYLGVSVINLDSAQRTAFPGQVGWKTIWINFFGASSDVADKLPTLRDIGRQMGHGRLPLFCVSIMTPGTILGSHRGPNKAVHRYLYGLSVPEGDTGMFINGQPLKYREREGYVFDDTIPHASWNLTGENRFLIMADVRRDLGPVANAATGLLYTLLGKAQRAKIVNKNTRI